MIDHPITHGESSPLRKILFPIALGLALALVGCGSINSIAPAKSEAATTQAAAISSAPLSLIPAPYSLERTPGYFELRDKTVLHVGTSIPEFSNVAGWFRDFVLRTRGIHLNVEQMNATISHAWNQAGGINFLIVKPLDGDSRADEGYSLTVSEKGIEIAASTGHGLFNGAITLWQLIALQTGEDTFARVPYVRIADYPRFAWRGLMLDSARHFQSPEFVKQFIDSMAIHKFNVLHWHLTDDQGWRIEIKKYPRLTEIGAWRQPAGAAGFDSNGKAVRYGGFYTQEQIRDIVRYAQERYVTIVPEIEMPGHAQAAIAAYPQLGANGKNPGVSSDWGVHTYLYNVDNSTFAFLEDVLTETMALFPSSYIHVGGDEAAKDQWQSSARVQARMKELGVKDEAAMQSLFIHRIETFLNAHGRKLIGWDEILEGGLPPQATVMSWRGSKGAIEAAKLGHDVVLSPDPDMYFDHLSGDLADEPAGRPSVISLQNVYDFNPLPTELDTAQAKHVLGAQANIWSEYLPTGASIEYAAYPRAAALAEVLWSPLSKHDWRDFLARLVGMEARYRKLGIEYAQSAFAVRIDVSQTAATNVQVKLSNQTDFGTIRYTLDGNAPTSQSSPYTVPFDTPPSGEVRATAFAADADGNDRPLANASSRKIDPLALLHRVSSELSACHPGQGVMLRLPDEAASEKYWKNYLVEIFDPCWLWPQADLQGIERIRVNIASLPYNFQLWKDIKSVKSHPTTRYSRGELQIHLDRCDGALLAVAALPVAPKRSGTMSIDTALPASRGKHDLCLHFATGKHDPLYVIDDVQLVPAPKP